MRKLFATVGVPIAVFLYICAVGRGAARTPRKGIRFTRGKESARA